MDLLFDPSMHWVLLESAKVHVVMPFFCFKSVSGRAGYSFGMVKLGPKWSNYPPFKMKSKAPDDLACMYL